MLSSELGGVVGAGPEAGTEATPEARPRARNCWCRRLGRKGWPGIICILAVSLMSGPLSNYLEQSKLLSVW